MMRRHPWLTAALAAACACDVALLTSCRQAPKPTPARRPRAELHAPPMLRVEVARAKSSLTLSIPGEYRLSCGRRVSGRSLPPTQVRLAPGGFVAGRERFQGSKLIAASPAGRPITVAGRRYRGRIVFERAAGGLSAVNEIDVETMLYGVVTAEMPAGWPMAALQAQAVAIRTYVLSRWRRRQSRRVHINRADVRYLGVSHESRRGREATDSTRGVVLMYAGAFVPAYFSAVCGGHTAPADTALGERLIPPLAGVVCGYCDDSPQFSWTLRVRAADLARRLGLSSAERVLAVRPNAPGRFRHAGRVVVETSRGERVFSGYRFRAALGADRLKSTAFEVRRAGDEFVFAGRGWGHGVGLCQWGARGMARAGASWRRIVTHYFPQAAIASAY